MELVEQVLHAITHLSLPGSAEKQAQSNHGTHPTSSWQRAGFDLLSEFLSICNRFHLMWRFTGPASLPGLLPDLLLYIASLTEAPEDVLALRSTCRQIRQAFDSASWASLTSSKWGPAALPPEATSQNRLQWQGAQAYTRRFHVVRSAEHLSGAWTDDRRYYTREAAPGQIDQQTLTLRTVFWLDLNMTFKVCLQLSNLPHTH